jgi:hypothetical protein
MGITTDPRFLAVARKRLGHLFPVLPDRAGFYKRREALSGTIEALIAQFAAYSPGNDDDVLLVDSTPGGVRPLARNGQTRRCQQPG